MTAGQKLLRRKTFAHAFMICFLVLILAPFVMVISASFREGNFAPSRLIPDKVSLDHWKYVFGIPYQEVVNPATGEKRLIKPATPPLFWFWNSIKVSFIASAGIIFLSGSAAYAFARLHFKFRSITLKSLLILQMFPMVLSLVAFYVILDFAGQYFRWTGLNTHSGLIMVYLGGISNYIWMIKGYFETIPPSMEESARIDGATPFQFLQLYLSSRSSPICQSTQWHPLFCSPAKTGRWRWVQTHFCMNRKNFGV